MTPLLWRWTGWFAFLLALDLIVPFFILTDHPSLSGSFLFWIIWTLVAIFSMFLMISRWQDRDRPPRPNND